MMADMGVLPFCDRSIDRVVAMEALHHAQDLAGTLKKVHRILKPGGIFYAIAEPVKGYLKNRTHGEKEIEEYHWNEHSYTRREYKEAFRAAGFSIDLFFPASIEARLVSRTPGPKMSNRILCAIGALIWKFKFLRRAVQGPLSGLLQTLFGYPMTIRALKNP
jgi:SAM-dependent methyltransferase